MFKSEEELSIDELNKYAIGEAVGIKVDGGNGEEYRIEGEITDFYWNRETGKWMYSYDELNGDGCDNDIPEDRIERLDTIGEALNA